MGGLTRLIREKAAAGCPVLMIPAEMPTTSTCSRCGNVREARRAW